MKAKIGVLFIFCVSVIVFVFDSHFVYAADEGEINELTEMYLQRISINSFNDNEAVGTFFELTGYNDLSEIISAIISGEFELSFKQIIERIYVLVKYELKTNINIFTGLVAVCLISTVFNGLDGNGANSTKLGKVLFAAFYYSVAFILFEVFLKIKADTLLLCGKLSDFSNEVVPVLLLLVCTGGGAVTYAALSPPLLFFAQLFISLVANVLIPVCSFCFVLSIIQNMSDFLNYSRIERLVEKASAAVLKCASFIFASVISFSGAAAAGADALKARGLRQAVKVLPVAGDFLAGAIDTVRVFGAVIQNSFGLIGVLGVIALLLIPLVKLIVMYLTLEFAAVVVQPFTDRRLYTSITSAASYIYRIFSYALILSAMLMIVVGIITLFGNYMLMLRT